MKDQLQNFLQALDGALVEFATEGQRLDLYIISRAALVLYHNLRLRPRGTKDLDVIQIQHPPTDLLAKAVALFGKETENAHQQQLCLELVPSGLPPVPGWFRQRSTEVLGEWRVLRLWQVEVHDLAATKLKSFRSQDREDLQFLCDQGKLSVQPLRQSLERAFIWSTPKDGDPDYDRAFAHLERVVQYLEGRLASL
jgi:hypothetical protein